jgi:chitinase
MSRRTLAALAALAALALPGVTASGADFTAATSTPANTFTAAADFNTVAATLTDPGMMLSGTVALAATASSERGITKVVFQGQLGAGAWADLCTATTAPWTCSWDTTAAANGIYALHALATDTAGYTRTSAVLGARMVDNLGPTVTLTDPGAYLQGTPTLSATASDTATGVSGLTIQYRTTGTTAWTQLCTGSTSPRSCAFASTAQPDGDYDLRATAVDAVGNSRSTAPLTRRVDNNAPTVTNTDGPTMRGQATITATAGDGAGTGVASVTGQVRPVGATPWTAVCTDTVAPYSCTYDTTVGVPDGLYEIRNVATDGTGLSTTGAIVTRRVDNTAPAVPTLVDPGTMTATATLTGTAADTGSGVGSWTVQVSPTGAGTWTDACSDTVTPWGSCAWNTTTVVDGLYDLRAVVADVAGNTRTSATIASRRVDNDGPTVSLTDPGANLRGTVALSATATDPVGMTSVVFERKPASGSTWTTMCTDNASPFTCSWNTTTLADGVYDLRVTATDTLGHASTATVSGRRVDNTAPAPLDIQTTNAGGTAGRIEANDTLRFTWTEPVSPASLLAGWTGASQAIRVQITDAFTQDTLQVLNSTGTATLPFGGVAADIKLRANFVSATAVFNATMVQSGSEITITLGTRRSGTVRTNTTAIAMTWRGSATATDLAGNASTTVTISETGTVDLDF